jgi:hypothetical protein
MSELPELVSVGSAASAELALWLRPRLPATVAAGDAVCAATADPAYKTSEKTVASAAINAT